LEEVCHLLEPLEVKVVIFMGGEAALDLQLPQLAAVLHREFSSYNILLTNGFKVISLEDIDEVVFSLKAHTDSLHRHFTGKSNKQALDNFIGLYQSGIKLRTESIFIPDYIDCLEIEHIARFIARVDRNIPYRIDAYIPVSDNPWRRPTSQEMKEAVSVAQRYLVNVSCLTGNEALKFDVLRVY
jgi:pyruvate formate lyase activating enzyme